MRTTPYRTLDDVVESFTRQEALWRAQQDRRCIFLTLYGTVSVEMRARVAQRAFADAEWVHRYAVAFANIYREVVLAYDAGRLDEVPKAWQLCFDAARSGSTLVLQDVLLGVNAHVNQDLPYALTAISIDPDRAARYADHVAVNEVLRSMADPAVARISALYAPGLTDMADVAGDLDAVASQFAMEVARESAWESAVSLANARSLVERALVSRFVASRAAVMARLLLAPSRSPRVRQACERAEQGSAWLTLAGAIRTAM